MIDQTFEQTGANQTDLYACSLKQCTARRTVGSPCALASMGGSTCRGQRIKTVSQAAKRLSEMNATERQTYLSQCAAEQRAHNEKFCREHPELCKDE